MKARQLFLSAALLFSIFAVALNAQERVPGLLPSPNSYRFMLIKGQLQPLKNSAPDPAEVWNDPIASFFFHKSTWKELDFTGDQIEKITAMKSKRSGFIRELGRRSRVFAKQATDANGKFDSDLYQKLIQQNLESLRKFNEGQETELRKIIPRHQWVQMAETLTRFTLKGEGFASQITKPEFTNYLELTEAQKKNLKSVSRQLIEENDRRMKQMARDSVRQLMKVLTKSQKEKLLKAIGAEDFSDFESINIVALNEQLRRFVNADKTADSGNKSTGKKSIRK